ncbi:MAG: hypothetical protein PHN18_00550 [Sulfurospirillaceae bacterium]|nr:hypothetical protein [Sulfurospirillaceae bacterium]MDD2826172.1 hypothetical protein [Sulfurospirillaceae bacterium]
MHTTLDKQTALILIDFQHGIINLTHIHMVSLRIGNMRNTERIVVATFSQWKVRAKNEY